jgi:hypothetical protein
MTLRQKHAVTQYFVDKKEIVEHERENVELKRETMVLKKVINTMQKRDFLYGLLELATSSLGVIQSNTQINDFIPNATKIFIVLGKVITTFVNSCKNKTSEDENDFYILEEFIRQSSSALEHSITKGEQKLKEVLEYYLMTTGERNQEMQANAFHQVKMLLDLQRI